MVGGVSEDTTSIAVVAALNDLQYDRVWIEQGVLSVEGLMRQHEDVHGGIEQDIEHLHMRAFASWSLMRVRFTDQEIETAICVATADAGRLNAASMLRGVLSDYLSDSQFDRVLDAACQLGLGSKAATYERYRRRWAECNADDAFLREGITSDIPAIHLLLARQSHNHWVLQELSQIGTSKEVRHTARQRLQHLEREQAGDA